MAVRARDRHPQAAFREFHKALRDRLRRVLPDLAILGLELAVTSFRSVLRVLDDDPVPRKHWRLTSLLALRVIAQVLLHGLAQVLAGHGLAHWLELLVETVRGLHKEVSVQLVRLVQVAQPFGISHPTRWAVNKSSKLAACGCRPQPLTAGAPARRHGQNPGCGCTPRPSHLPEACPAGCGEAERLWLAEGRLG